MRWLATILSAILAGACNPPAPANQEATASTPDGPFYAGMTFAHEGYQGYNGYGGRTVAPSLDSLTSLNVNAVAIVPYTFMRGTDSAGNLPVPDHRGAENDTAVCHAIRQAKARGLSVMLKPQIWVQGAWPGDVDMATEAEWNDFFAAYRRWMGHYARLAEREEVSVLCVGTELVRATLDHPDRWREMIAYWRETYSGKLTYAANWGEEFENLTFWDELDIIGLNAYYPLSSSNNPTDEELIDGARKWMTMAGRVSERYDRPLWLTEIGYRSVAGAWQNPHAEAGDREVSLVAQQRCYSALVEAAGGSSRLRGIFIWKWPSYLGHDEGRDGQNNGYVPGGKPAGRVLSSFYATQD